MIFSILRSAAQVMFQNSPLAGGLFLIGIGSVAFIDREFYILVSAVCCTIVGIIFAYLLKANTQHIRNGLYAYNALLIGIAGAVFLRPSVLMVGMLFTGTVLSVLLMYLMLEKIPKAVNFPALTFPFVFMTWVIIFLIQRYFPELRQNALPSPSTDYFIQGPLNSFSQIFILENSFTGALILAGLFLSASIAGVYSLLAVILTFMASYGRGLDPGHGLYSYNAILTAIALGSVFLRKGKEAFIGTILGITLTLAYQELLGHTLAPHGLPILTAPFVLAVWTVLAGRIFLKSKTFI